MRAVDVDLTVVSSGKRVAIVFLDNEKKPVEHFFHDECLVKEFGPRLQRMWVMLSSSSSVRSKVWTVPLNCHDRLCTFFLPRVSPVPRPLLEWCTKFWTTTSVEHRSKLELAVDRTLDANIKKTMYPHQLEALKKAVSLQKSFSFLEMGAGKTYVGIAFLTLLKASAPPLLVVCPSSLRNNWIKEIKKFAPWMKTHLLKSSDDAFDSSVVNVISYSLLASKKMKRSLIGFCAKTIVYDECHYMKNHTSNRSKICVRQANKASFVLMLSGTPGAKALNFFPQLKAILPGIFGSFFHYNKQTTSPKRFFFAERYCQPEKVFLGGGRQTGWKFNGSERTWEMNAVMGMVSSRVRKDDVLDLPPKTRLKYEISTLSAGEREEWKKLLDKLTETREKKGSRKADFDLMSLVRKVSDMKVGRIASTLEWVCDDRRPDDKVILFFHHQAMKSEIERVLSKKKKDFVTIDGSVPPKKRQAIIDRFQDTKSNVDFACLSLMACSTGLNIQASNCVIITELLFNVELLMQAEDRAHRAGQKREVEITYLTIGGTSDDLIFRSIQKKVKTSGKILDNKTERLKFN